MNPYTTIEECDEFALRIADVSAWAAASLDSKERALLQASDEIDSLRFAGHKYEADQVRQFPRFLPDSFPQKRSYSKGGCSFATIWDIDAENNVIVPAAVKFATFLQALSILQAGDAARRARLQDQADNVASQSAGGVSEAYGTGKASIICLQAMAQLRPYLLKSGNVY